MAIVNALRFDARSGALAADEESWHLRRRKTYFSVNLQILLEGPETPGGLLAAYGGVGDPDFHGEVVRRARTALAAAKPATLEEVGGIVLDAMHASTRRASDARLRFLFGFGADDLNRGSFERGDETFELRNADIVKRARDIVEGKETTPEREALPPNQACLMGWDPASGFRMFCLKESDGVLSFNAGDFESLGPGRYAGGMRLTGALGETPLAARRSGVGAAAGLKILLESMLDAAQHFGMVGGRVHLVLLDAGEGPKRRLRRLDADLALLATEAVRAARGNFIGADACEEILAEAVKGRLAAPALEKRLFAATGDAAGLELHLRGYKIRPAGAARPKGPRRTKR